MWVAVNANLFMSDRRNNNKLIHSCSAVSLLYFRKKMTSTYIVHGERERLIERREWESEEFTIIHPRGRTRYEIFKAQQNKQCKKLHAERLTNLQQGDFFSLSLNVFFTCKLFWDCHIAQSFSLSGALFTEVLRHMTHLYPTVNTLFSQQKYK